MQRKFSFYSSAESIIALAVICYLVVAFSSFVEGEAACQSLPISVSSINNCKDGVCTMEVVAAGALDIITAKTQCLELYLEKKGKLATLNITLASAFASQGVNYCYYTDDPLVDTRGACGCHLSVFEGQCPDCYRAIPNWGDNMVCHHDQTYDTPCFANALGAGWYCARTGFSAQRRFKVCGLKPKEPMKAVIRIDTDTGTDFWELNTNNKVFVSADETVKFQTATSSFEVRDDIPFYVVDLLGPYDLWFGSDSLVNGMNGYDYTKIGWYKKGAQLEADLGQLRDAIDISLKKSGCPNSDANNAASLNVRYRFINPSTILNNNPGNFAKNSEPNAYVVDKEVEEAQKNNKPETTSQGSDFWQLKDGFFGYGYMTVAKIVFVGLGADGNYIPTVYETLAANFTVATSRGRKITTRWNLHCSEAWLKDSCGQVCVAETDEYPGEYGFCVLSTCQVISNGTVPMDKFFCSDLQFYAVNWPSQQLVRYDFTGAGGMQITYPQFDNSKNTLFIPAKRASIVYTLTMRNMTIKFINSDVRPLIKNCTQNGNGVDIEMKSESAEGNSIATMLPGIYPSQTYYLTKEFSKFFYPISQNTSGKVDIVVRVADYSVSCNLTLELEFGTDYEFSWKNVTGLPSNFLGLLAGLKLPVLPEVSSIIFWAGIVIAVIICIVLFIVGIVLFIMLLPYIMPLFSCCCMCCGGRGTSRKSK